VGLLEVLPFTREMASLTPEEFIERHVVTPYAPHAVVVGEGFALGRGRSGDVRRLSEIGLTHGFVVESVPLTVVDGAPVSSTRVRLALGEGRVDVAARLLGRRYDLTGQVVTGAGIGRRLGYPTANLRLHEEKLVPRDGIYAVLAGIGDEPPRRPAAMSIGVRPTFDGTVRTLEVHLLDFDAPLVGLDVTVELVEWLRPELRFEGPEQLVAAIDADVAETRRRLAGVS
jgi:riboflavin kinase/FMN adenylyltransferase